MKSKKIKVAKLNTYNLGQKAFLTPHIGLKLKVHMHRIFDNFLLTDMKDR